MTARALALTLLALGLTTTWPALAEEADADTAGPWSTRLRLDAILRWAPRYVVEVDRTEWGANRLFWRRVDQLPLYLRVGLDSSWRQAEGPMSADIHTSAWAGLDLAVGTAGGGLVAGDFALAYGRFTYGPVSVWAGRRFVPWGPPGGLQIDGGGVELRTRFGLSTEVVVGRPVTPVYNSLLGVQTSFEGATLAYGALVGYRYPSRVSAAVAYSERWREGIPADRLLSAEVTAVPHQRLDLRGSLVFDPVELAVEQATAQLFVLVIDPLELDVGYAYTDPTRLIPRWSILASFASGAFHEASIGGTVTLAQSHMLRAEGALRRYIVAGRDDEDDEAKWLGYRADLIYRWMPRHRRYQVRAGASRRADEAAGLTVIHGAMSWALTRILQLAFEAAISIDDDRDRARDSYLARVAFDVDLGRSWHLGATIDGARTAFVEAELRGMVRATWSPTWGAQRRRWQ